MSKRSAGIFAILIGAVVLGALREFLFLNLNYEIDHMENHRAVSYAHSMFRAAVDGFSLRTLLGLKWALAVFFIGLTLGLSILLARILFGDQRYRNLLVIGFLVIGAIAFLLHACASIHPAFDLVSVKLLHMLQFPIVLFFLWAAALLQRKAA